MRCRSLPSSRPRPPRLRRNAEAIADKMLANAQEVFARVHN